ncbi:winged helix-turn-helix domain-containing protein [Thermus caldilimi]|uniref:winged helix-turn-helix domain-containing protein n=1 Tax=Thermus caldilimi TaxID=2483360 RepID=UPI001F0F535A|nr:winged helix-turn-helix domain-containing protein [Thermus caldilimi]
MRGFLATLLVVSYAFALVMSTGHLSEWYRLTLGNLPGWFAVGLAAALEMSAFLLSLLSNSLLRGSRWASWGAVVALGLVWVGNYFSMRRAGIGVAEVEVFLSSLFVPVSTFVIAKVLGELLEGQKNAVTWVSQGEVHLGVGGPKAETKSFLLDVSVNSQEPESAEGRAEVNEEETGSFRQSKGSHEDYLRVLQTPRTAKELVEIFGVSKAAVYKRLKALEEKGLVEKEGGRWVVRSGPRLMQGGKA